MSYLQFVIESGFSNKITCFSIEEANALYLQFLEALDSIIIC